MSSRHLVSPVQKGSAAESSASPEGRSLKEGALPNGKRNRTQEAQSGHKKHKKDLILRIFCASCALICASCVLFLFPLGNPRQYAAGDLEDCRNG